MRESRTYGSVRGALSNGRPYRDRFARNDGGENSGAAVPRDRAVTFAIPGSRSARPGMTEKWMAVRHQPVYKPALRCLR